MSDAFDASRIISGWGGKKTGIIGFYLSMSRLLFLCFLQCRRLVFVEDYTFLSSFADNAFWGFWKGRHIVPQPNGANYARWKKNVFITMLFGYTDLTQCLIGCRHLHGCILDVLLNSIIYDRVAAGNLLQDGFTPFVHATKKYHAYSSSSGFTRTRTRCLTVGWVKASPVCSWRHFPMSS